jgi:hypothetical protein
VSARNAFRLRVTAYRAAFGALHHRAWWARLGTRLGLARVYRLVRSENTYLAIALADLERFCRARPDQTTFVPDDPTGRTQAYAEGLRQAYLRIAAHVALTPAEYHRALEALAEDERGDQQYAA